MPKFLLTAGELNYEPTEKWLIMLEGLPHSPDMLVVLIPLQLHAVPG